MQQYMINTTQVNGNKITLGHDDIHHIFNVMRMKENDQIICVDTHTKIKYYCLLTQDSNIAEIIEESSQSNELEKELVLAFGLVKADKLEFVFQKACELGVTKFIPLEMQHSIVKFEDKKLEKKMERWKKIVKEACEQAERNTLMEIVAPIKIKELEKYKRDLNLLVYERASIDYKIRDAFQRDKSALLVIGPEGGFSIDEVELLKEKEFEQVSLGKRILRCETAAISAVSIISDLME